MSHKFGLQGVWVTSSSYALQKSGEANWALGSPSQVSVGLRSLCSSRTSAGLNARWREWKQTVTPITIEVRPALVRYNNRVQHIVCMFFPAAHCSRFSNTYIRHCLETNECSKQIKDLAEEVVITHINVIWTQWFCSVPWSLYSRLPCWKNGWCTFNWQFYQLPSRVSHECWVLQRRLRSMMRKSLCNALQYEGWNIDLVSYILQNLTLILSSFGPMFKDIYFFKK